MFQDMSEVLVPMLQAKGLDGHLAKIWVYNNHCLVLGFSYRNVRFAFDCTPSDRGLISVDIVEKRHKSDFRVTAVGGGKERIASDLPLGQAFDRLHEKALQVFSAVDRHAGSDGPTSAAAATEASAAPSKPTAATIVPKKVGVLTLPFNANIGGNLQGFALMEALRQLGHQPVLVNRRKAAKGVPADAAAPADGAQGPLITDTMAISHVPNRAFIEKYVTPISREFHTSADLAETIDKYRFDAVVVGSDQVWRPKYAKSILYDFFLKFISDDDKRIKKISYAASFGTSDWEYDDEQTRAVASLAGRFDAISVREDSGVALCRDNLGVEAHHVLDPTLLLTPEHYLRIFSSHQRRSPAGQLLAYILDRSEDKLRVVDTLSKRLSVNAYSTSDLPFAAAGATAEGEGEKSVEGWLAAIHQSAFVVTDSFHGAVFSILFNKPFIAYGNPKRGMARFTSLMKMLGLEDRLVVKSAEINFDKMLRPIDWDAVNTRIETLRTESKRFLTAALAGEDIPRKGPSAAKVAESKSIPPAGAVFTSNNGAWTITPLDHAVELAVVPGSAVRGNLVWCDLPCVIARQTQYRLTITWVVRTRSDAVNLHIRSNQTGKFRVIGSVATKGAPKTRRIDSFDFVVPDEGFNQFMLGALNFTGEGAGAEISNITVQKLPGPDVQPAKSSSNYAKNSERLALQDHERYVGAYEEAAGIGAARARLMWNAHAIEKGLSHADFRTGFGKAVIQKLANEMETWLALGRSVDDQFFKAAAAVTRVYFERHRKLGVDTSEAWEFCSPGVKAAVLGADVSFGGVMASAVEREAKVETNRDRSFLDVVFSRRSVREFTAAPVEDELIRRAVKVAQQAPSVCNRQAPRVHHFKDAETIKAAVDLQRGFRGYKMPPTLLLVTSDLTAFLSPNERNQAFIDGGLFMMSLLLGLEQAGLGACCLNTAMNADRENSIRALLKIPETEVFISFIAVGHFDPAVLTPISKRYPVEQVLVHHHGAAAG